MIKNETQYNWYIRESAKAILRKKSYFITADIEEFAVDICLMLEYTTKSVQEVGGDISKYMMLIVKKH